MIIAMNKKRKYRTIPTPICRISDYENENFIPYFVYGRWQHLHRGSN
jgi:hypothetical protein